MRTSNKVATGKIGCLVSFFSAFFSPALTRTGNETKKHQPRMRRATTIFHLLTIGDLIVFELFHKFRNMSRLPYTFSLLPKNMGLLFVLFVSSSFAGWLRLPVVSHKHTDDDGIGIFVSTIKSNDY